MSKYNYICPNCSTIKEIIRPMIEGELPHYCEYAGCLSHGPRGVNKVFRLKKILESDN